MILHMSVTREQILDVAEELVRLRGYNAFSFRDLSERIGIRAPSVHHHFATKGDLCLALIVRHRAALSEALATIDRGVADPVAKLRKYAKIFQDAVKNGNRMCLCGMMASDVETLPTGARDELKLAIQDHEVWLAGVLDQGRKEDVFRFDGPPLAQALWVFASLEGALLIARTYGDPLRFAAMARTLIDRLSVPR